MKNEAAPPPELDHLVVTGRIPARSILPAEALDAHPKLRAAPEALVRLNDLTSDKSGRLSEMLKSPRRVTRALGRLGAIASFMRPDLTSAEHDACQVLHYKTPVPASPPLDPKLGFYC